MVFAVRMHSWHLHYMCAYRLQHLQLREVWEYTVCAQTCVFAVVGQYHSLFLHFVVGQYCSEH